MAAATRQGDNCTGHDACAAVPLVTCSSDVLINGRGAGRQGDTYASHGCIFHPGHSDVIVGGSGTVLINGMPAAREGDSVSIGGSVAEGSPNVIIGG